MIQYGTKIVWGLPTEKQKLTGIAKGSYRYYFRSGKAAKVFLRTANGVTENVIGIDENGAWYPIQTKQNFRVKATTLTNEQV